MAGGLATDGRMEPAIDALGPAQLITLFRIISERMTAARDELGVLDGVIGDADHGSSMAAGFSAVLRAVSQAEGTPGAIFSSAASEFLGAVGATTGPLYASALLRAAKLCGDRPQIPVADFPLLIPAFAEGITERGKARPGDKTMMDAWAPAARAVLSARERGEDPLSQMRAAVEAAREGAASTRAMVASRGRAARLGERSLGHTDPGAVSAVILIEAMHDLLARGLA